MRTHVVSQQLHQLHVAALLPPQARLERLEKALAIWRLIRIPPAKTSRIVCQTASDHRKRRYRYAHCYRCSSPVPGARVSPRALLPPALRNQLENSNRVIAVTRKIQRYGQRHIRSDSVSFYVLSLHQHQRPLRTRQASQACGR